MRGERLKKRDKKEDKVLTVSQGILRSCVVSLMRAGLIGILSHLRFSSPLLSSPLFFCFLLLMHS